jgi:RNA-dependent RNA polymerase
MVDKRAAMQALRETIDPNLITLNLASMLEADFSLTEEPFVMSLIQLWRAWTLKYLKEKAKIPVCQGAFVLGVADETDTLKGHVNDLQAGPRATEAERHEALPEIFIQITDAQNSGKRRIIQGVCIIARNPSLHRGDIRVVKAIDTPNLHHLCDVLVMPAKGDRDLPSMCSGGDLDGDDYIVVWDEELIPTLWNVKPFHYNAPDPVTKKKISTNDIIGFFCDYMQNDFLGRIANAHLAAADYLDDGLDSKQCLKLVELHSIAVDYPKTGVPAVMTRDLDRPK